MAAKSGSRSATYSGTSDKSPAEEDALYTKYSSYDDSNIGKRTTSRFSGAGTNVDAADTLLLLDPGGNGEDAEKDSISTRRALSQRISASLSVKLPARLRRTRAHALGRRRASTRIDDSFINISKNTPKYVINMDSHDLIE